MRRCAVTTMMCLAAVAVTLPACSAHRSAATALAFQRPAPARSSESLASYAAKMRALSAAAKPASIVSGQALESWDPRLSAALAELIVSPTPEAHRHVALEYRRLGVLDMAHDHFAAALRLDPDDAAAHDGLARIWRDWGFPELGLADARRAVQIAPLSAAAANTLGTLLESAGQMRQARKWYTRAASLDPGAYYALNNLCYTAIMTRLSDSVAACTRAQAAAPESGTARNNLGLAYAAGGDFEKAREQFKGGGDAAADFNMGVLYMGRQQYQKAVKAFDDALESDPQFTLAATRARQARGSSDGKDDARDSN
jgi:tetratricopeptide (TPR) repeat protein